MFRSRELVYHMPDINEARKHVQDQLSQLNSHFKRLVNPDRYPVGLERGLYDIQIRLICRNSEMIS